MSSTSLHQTISQLPSKELILKRGELLKRGNTKDNNIYFIVEGSLRMYIIHENEEQNIRFAYKNNIISALDSFLNGKNSPLYIEAIKKCIVKVISKKDFMHFTQQNKEQQQWWQSILEDLILQQMEREIDLLTSSPEERYKRVLKRSPQLFQEIPSKYIANYLRMTAETLSRIKKS